VRQLRKKRGWTQDQLAEHSGLSGTAVSKIEVAETFAELDSVFALAGALEVKASSLIDGLDDLIGSPTEFLKDESR
jgi:transcriptional regulator with XRE-family HTH domain